MMRLAIDAQGGDFAPAAIIQGCAMALRRFEDIELFIAGSAQAQSLLESNGIDARRVVFQKTTQQIEMSEPPVQAIKSKTDSSLVVAMQALSSGKAQGLISAGSTGAVLAGATLLVRRIKGIKRPALAPIMPTVAGPVLLIDCGANVDSKPQYLAEFGMMGSVYMRHVLSVDNPRVALINNGSEAEKGCALTKAAYALMQQMPYNFVGNIEAREIPMGAADVAVADGFAGNIALKMYEGAAGAVVSMLKTEMQSSLRSKLGAALLMPALRRFKKKMDYTEYGGAPLLGIDGVVIKAHGSSNAKAICNAIRQARDAVQGELVEHIRAGVQPQ